MSSRSRRLEGVLTGEAIALGKTRAPVISAIAPPEPVHAIAVSIRDRKDDVRLASALARLTEEDPALVVAQSGRAQRDAAVGAGRDASARDAGAAGGPLWRGGRPAGRRRSAIARRSARRPARAAAIASRAAAMGSSAMSCWRSRRCRAARACSSSTASAAAWCRGSTSPRSRPGCAISASRGPLGFPLLDIAVTLTDGSYHSVDSSDMAFRQAARIAMAEATAQARPVLLEPILAVEIVDPLGSDVARLGHRIQPARPDPRL